MSLLPLQRWMHDALVFPRRVDPDTVDEHLLSSHRLPAADGLAIYQRGYFLRIAACMREQFPALCHALGAELFDDFVADYIRDAPPESYTLYDLGRRFPAWLDANRPDRDAPRESWIDFMVDLARFEYAIFAMFDAPGHEGKHFATADTPDAQLHLQPAFALGAWRYPVAPYYHAVRDDRPTEFPPAEPSFVALVRTDYLTRTIPLAEPHYRFLETMAAGGSAEDAIEAVAPLVAMDPGEVRRVWHQQGVRQRWIDWGFFIAAE